MYNIIDLLDKIIKIKEKTHDIYKTISVMNNIDENIKVVARILATQERRHILSCKSFRGRILEKPIPTIDFDIYDKASNLMSGFMFPDPGHIKDINQLLSFALDFENQSMSLLMSIQGLLIRESEEKSTVTYDVLSKLIQQQKTHIINIENFLQ